MRKINTAMSNCLSLYLVFSKNERIKWRFYEVTFVYLCVCLFFFLSICLEFFSGTAHRNFSDFLDKFRMASNSMVTEPDFLKKKSDLKVLKIDDVFYVMLQHHKILKWTYLHTLFFLFVFFFIDTAQVFGIKW